MIVVCPSCGTPFRHPASEGAGARRGTCSRCSVTFPLAARPSYRVEPAVAAGPGGSVCGGAALAMGVAVAAGEARPCGEAPAPERRDAPGLAFGMDDPALLPSLGATALDSGSSRPRPAMTYWVVADDAPKAAPVRGRRTPPVRTRPRAGRALGLVAAMALGATAFGSAGFGVTAWTGWPAGAAALGGAAAGTLLAWGMLRWKARPA